jgi:hypothetical protein
VVLDDKWEVANKSGCEIGWVSDGQSQWYIYGKLWGRWLENLPEWWVIVGDKWEVATTVDLSMEFNGS